MTDTGLGTTFAALADTTRRGILSRLAGREVSVTDLAKPFGISLPAISRHLKVLEAAGLVGRRKEGRVHKIHLTPAPLKEATEWMNRHSVFWMQKLDALEAYLAESKTSEETTWKRAKQNPHSRSGDSSRRRPKKSSRRGRNRNT